MLSICTCSIYALMQKFVKYITSAILVYQQLDPYRAVSLRTSFTRSPCTLKFPGLEQHYKLLKASSMQSLMTKFVLSLDYTLIAWVGAWKFMVVCTNCNFSIASKTV